MKNLGALFLKCHETKLSLRLYYYSVNKGKFEACFVFTAIYPKHWVVLCMAGIYSPYK